MPAATRMEDLCAVSDVSICSVSCDGAAPKVMIDPMILVLVDAPGLLKTQIVGKLPASTRVGALLVGAELELSEIDHRTLEMARSSS